MRIALTYPWTWPHVQRGGERLTADLARWLAGRGHEVVVVTAGPTPGRRRDPAGFTVVEHRGLDHPRLRRVDLDQAVTYLPAAAATLRRLRPDVVHGLHHLDGVACRLAGRSACVVHLQGMPVRASLTHRPVHRRLLPRSIRAARVVATVSRAAAGAASAELGIAATPVLNGVLTADFAAARATASPSARPSILFPGDPADERKRLRVLVDAVQRLHAAWPELLLRVAAPVDRRLAAGLQERLGRGVELLDIRSPSAMPAAYASTSVTCLPAVREAFGLVVVESLATGTPAVAVRDGGIPEVLSEPRWLASADDADDLAAALDRALEDAQRPDVVDRCQALAAPFDWSVRGPAFEGLYTEALEA